jgi:hypothetical protein
LPTTAACIYGKVRVADYLQVAPVTRLTLHVGTDPSLKAALLASHLDVVPIANPEAWSYPPFGAEEVETLKNDRLQCLDPCAAYVWVCLDSTTATSTLVVAWMTR